MKPLAPTLERPCKNSREAARQRRLRWLKKQQEWLKSAAEAQLSAGKVGGQQSATGNITATGSTPARC